MGKTNSFAFNNFQISNSDLIHSIVVASYLKGKSPFECNTLQEILNKVAIDYLENLEL